MSLLLCRLFGIPLTPEIDSGYTDQTFRHYLLSIAGELRLQMHTTGLYAGVFATLGLAGLLWVMAEKWQTDSEWDNQDAVWMISFEALLALSAIIYKMGANSTVIRKFAMAGAMADVFGIGVALSVPAILWFHWHKPGPKKKRQDDEDSISSFDFSRTILGLQDYSPPPSPAPPPALLPPEAKPPTAVATSALVLPPVDLPAAPIEKMVQEQSEKNEEQPSNEAIVMENMNNILSIIDSQPTASTQQPAQTQPEATPATSQPFAAQPASVAEPVMSQSYTPQPAAPQPMAAQPPAYQPMTSQPPAPERPGVPATTFRDQLFALNNSWQRIESTGKEMEDWFQNQQKRVMAHLERPIAKGRDNVDFSRDFLEQRMERIDAEWATIHQTVRNLYRWLENGSLEKEAPQETKVW
jgi:hypothetical protein